MCTLYLQIMPENLALLARHLVERRQTDFSLPLGVPIPTALQLRDQASQLPTQKSMASVGMILETRDRHWTGETASRLMLLPAAQVELDLAIHLHRRPAYWQSHID
jgi:hypothetical protein